MNAIDGTFAILFALLIMHALCDYPLQGDFLSRCKSPENSFERGSWLICLTMHCLIQAGGVWLILGIQFALAELVLHFLTDLAKIKGITNFREDQALHVIAKIVYVSIACAPSPWEWL